MKVLVVHDRTSVRTKISKVLIDLNVSPDSISVAEDSVQAKQALQQQLFDLVILDLTLPHLAGHSEAKYETAEELLLEIFEGHGLNVPGDLIGITKEKNALESVDTKIGPHLMAVIHETDTSQWTAQLRDRVRYIQKATNSRLRSLGQNYDYDAAIITALDIEMEPYHSLFALSKHPHLQGGYEFLFNCKDSQVRTGLAFSIGQAGQVSAASATQAILTQFRPEVVALSGICGGFEKKTELGDIILFQSVYDWDSGKWDGSEENAEFAPRPEPINFRNTPMDEIVRDIKRSGLEDEEKILGNANALSNGLVTKVGVKLGAMASGSSVVADKRMIPKIKQINEKILGVEMEAYGFAFAARNTPVKTPNLLIVKAVSDYCDEEKEDSYQSACCFLSASAIEQVLRRRWSFGDPS